MLTTVYEHLPEAGPSPVHTDMESTGTTYVRYRVGHSLGMECRPTQVLEWNVDNASTGMECGQCKYWNGMWTVQVLEWNVGRPKGGGDGILAKVNETECVVTGTAEE